MRLPRRQPPASLLAYLTLHAWTLCASASPPPNPSSSSSSSSSPSSSSSSSSSSSPPCPSACSCSGQSGKVVCTRRGLSRAPPGVPPNTRYLNLMENNIALVQADTFRHLHRLEVLQLGRNSIRQVEVGAFSGLANLNTLELFDNWLTVVPSGAFEYLSKLRELWLRNNPIESIPSYAFNRVPSLLRLDLGELKKLEYISEGAFEGLDNLKYLNLGMCNMREVPNLSPLIGLEELELSGNHFPRLHPGAFRGLRALRKLWIMSSQISSIERNAFDELTALVELNLAHNNLTSLPHDLFAPLRFLVEPHLHHNPWACGCDALWLAAWLRESIPSNSSCCGRCHAPPAMRGRFLLEVERAALRCSAPFLADAPTDLNISEGRGAALRCRTGAMAAVRWLLPNGEILSHASTRPRLNVLHDGTLNFSHVLTADTGTYTCMAANAAGSSNASAYLNVTAAELDASAYSFFTTVTVETTETAPDDSAAAAPKAAKSTPPTAPTAYRPAYTATTTILIRGTRRGPTAPPADADHREAPHTSLDEVMRTTKIIIGCFVAVTLLAAAMLIAFYKLRKRHQRRATVTAARTVEIIQVDEDVAAATTTGATAATAAVRMRGDVGVVGEHRPAPHCPASWMENSSLHAPGAPRAEPFLLHPHCGKERVQETQI